MQPNPSTEAIESPLDRLASFRLAAERGDGPVLWRQFQAALGVIASEIDAEIVLQPDDIRESDIFTDATWGTGVDSLQRGMEAKHANRDALHMNAGIWRVDARSLFARGEVEKRLRLDEVVLTLARDTAISKYEDALVASRPWIAGESRNAGIAVEGVGRT